MTLEQLGWNSHWERVYREAVASAPGSPCIAGRVCAAHRGLLDIETTNGSIRLHAHEGNIGDWVLVHPEAPRLVSVLPRCSQILRKSPGTGTEAQLLAANVDVALVVMGLDGDFNLRRLERYLVLIRESTARPVVVLNKADVCADISGRLAEVRHVARNAPILAVSALRDPVADALSPHLFPGESVALLGSSGAGKSTILNMLLGEHRQQTGPVREHDSRGRHTTTSRQLILSPQGWLIFDLPGLRELQLWAGRDSLDAAFGEISELSPRCRFRDCRHQGEPGCAVAGAVSPERLDSFHRLERELEHLEERQGGLAAQNTKRRWKQIHKAMRHHPKYKR